jgi:hypothetical protein
VNLHIVLLCEHPPGVSFQIAGLKNPRPWRGPPTEPRPAAVRSASPTARLHEQPPPTRSALGNFHDQKWGDLRDRRHAVGAQASSRGARLRLSYPVIASRVLLRPRPKPSIRLDPKSGDDASRGRDSGRDGVVFPVRRRTPQEMHGLKHGSITLGALHLSRARALAGKVASHGVAGSGSRRFENLPPSQFWPGLRRLFEPRSIPRPARRSGPVIVPAAAGRH